MIAQGAQGQCSLGCTGAVACWVQSALKADSEEEENGCLKGSKGTTKKRDITPSTQGKSHLEKNKKRSHDMHTQKKSYSSKKESAKQRRRVHTWQGKKVLHKDRDVEIAKSLMALFYRPNRKRIEGTKLQRTALHLRVTPG